MGDDDGWWWVMMMMMMMMMNEDIGNEDRMHMYKSKISTLLAFKALTCFSWCFASSWAQSENTSCFKFISYTNWWCIKKESPPPRFPTFHPHWLSICSCSWHLFRHHFYIKKANPRVFHHFFMSWCPKSPGKKPQHERGRNPFLRWRLQGEVYNSRIVQKAWGDRHINCNTVYLKFTKETSWKHHTSRKLTNDTSI